MDLGKLAGALAALESNLSAMERDTVAGDEVVQRAVACGIVQAFEVAYEVARSFMQRKMVTIRKKEEVDRLAKRELFFLAEELGLIPSWKRWYEFHLFRNNSSHNYDDGISGAGLAMARTFLAAGKALLEVLGRD
jgi:hypothetical protein